MSNVTVRCRLPHGLVLEVGTPHTLDNGKISPTYKSVELNGLNKARRGAKFGETLVPREIWNAWLAKNKTLRYVVDGSVFVIP